MSSRRVLKVASAIREVVSMAILTDIKDPRVENVTVTSVEVTGDLREAKVHVSIMGDEKKQQLCLHGLRSSAGYLQQRIGNRVDLRYTPRLDFKLDEGVKNAAEIERILKEVLPQERKANEAAAEPTTEVNDEQPSNDENISNDEN